MITEGGEGPRYLKKVLPMFEYFLIKCLNKHNISIHYFIIRSDLRIADWSVVLIWNSIAIEYCIVFNIFVQYIIEYSIVDQNLV